MSFAPYIKILDGLSQRVNELSSKFQTKPFLKLRLWFQYSFLAAILAYLLYRLTHIGWGDVIGALPSSPLFYVLAVAMFLVPPLIEKQSYKLITGHSVPGGLSLFCRKRVYNEAVISYAGEAYLCDKLANIPGYNHRKALIAVKDNNLVSALMSNSWTLILVLAVFLFGRSDILTQIWDLAPLLVGSFMIICLVIYGGIFAFIRHITALKPALLVRIGLLHMGKILIVAVLQVLQWISAMPSEMMQTWLILLTVQILIKRIPGLPNADLIFLGVGLSLVGFAQGSAIEVTAMLVTATAMTQIVYLIAFVVTSGPKAALSNRAISK